MAVYLSPHTDQVTCTTHGNNYTWTVPPDTKKVEVKPRDGAASEDCRMAFSTADMSAGKYALLQSLSTYSVNNGDCKEMITPGTTFIFQFAVDDARVVDIIYYTEYNYPRIS